MIRLHHEFLKYLSIVQCQGFCFQWVTGLIYIYYLATAAVNFMELNSNRQPPTRKLPSCRYWSRNNSPYYTKHWTANMEKVHNKAIQMVQLIRSNNYQRWKPYINLLSGKSIQIFFRFSFFVFLLDQEHAPNAPERTITFFRDLGAIFNTGYSFNPNLKLLCMGPLLS